MRKVLGSLSLLVLLLNTLLTPITYAGEYEEIIVITSDSQKNQVEENGEEEDSSEFSVEEKNVEDILDEENEEEENDEDAEVDSGTVAEEGIGDIEEIWDDEGLTGKVVEGETGSVVEEGTGDTIEVGNGETGGLTGETINSETGSLVEGNTGAVSESTGGSTSEEGTGELIKYNETPITGERIYDDVTVRVEALTGIFPEGTELVIEPIKWWNLWSLKDQLVEGKQEVKEDTTVVAFDITFIYSGEEVQPKEGEKVKVAFDYSSNKELTDADEKEEQEVKVYHIEDKDSEGNELEKEEQKIVDVTNKEESKEEGIAVADGESFSIYVLTIVENNPNTITLDGKGGELNSSTNITDIICNDQTGLCTGNVASEGGDIRFPSASRAHAYFLGWIGSGASAGLSTLTKNPVLPVATVVGQTYKAKYTCDYGYVDIDDECIPLADAPANGIVYDSESQTITVWGDVDGTKMRYTIQDRNVGATETGAYNVYTDAARGKYFQYGNNNGLYRNQTHTFLDNSVNVGNIVPSIYSGSLVKIDKFPYVTTNGTGYLNIWGYYSKINDWEARRGPCPVGYHVPSDVEFKNILKTLGSTTWQNALSQLWLPGVGWGYNNGTKLGTQKDCQNENKCQGKYHQLRIDKPSTRYYVAFESGKIGSVTSSDANRYFPVRCFQDYANCLDGQVKRGLDCLDFLGIKITFDANGGTVLGDDEYVTEDDEAIINLSNYTAEKSGYYFVGWNTDKNATRGLTGEKTYTSNTTLYAIYLKLYTYTFVDTEGTILGTGYYESGVVSDMTKLLTLNYYSDETGDISIYDDLITLGISEAGKGRRWTPEIPEDGIATGDLILTGEIVDVFDVTFLDYYGADFLIYRVLSGTIFQEPESYPRAPGLQFDGWYEQNHTTPINFPMTVTDDITIYPNFVDIYCTFTTGYSDTYLGIKIIGFSGEQTDECLNNFVIPSEIDGVEVVEINTSAFNGTLSGAQIISGEILLPDTIKFIGEAAFKNNNISGEFRFPKNIIDIYQEAFYGNRLSGTLEYPGTISPQVHKLGTAFTCNLIENLVIGTGITQIGDNAFNIQNCTTKNTLKSVIFPSTLTIIGSKAFYNQIISGELSLPDGVTFIGENAFNSNNISSLIFPSGGTIEIQSSAFYNNNISGTLVIPGNLKNGTITSAFRCNLIEEVNFSSGITKIDGEAFNKDNCPTGKGGTIKSISLPDSITTIGSNAFKNNQIEGELVIPDSVVKIGSYAFGNNKISGTLFIPGRVNSGVVNDAFKYNYLEKIIFGSGVTKIDNNAFNAKDQQDSLKRQIKSVEFPSTLTGIGDNAFWNQRIESLEFPDSLISIGQHAFDSQGDASGKTLKYIDLGNGVENIGSWAFISNPLLNSVYIPDSVETLGGGAFNHNKNPSYTIGYATTKKSTLNYTGAYIKPVYQLYTYTFVDTGGNVLGTGYYPDGLESNTTRLIPISYYNGVGNVSDFTGVDSLIAPGEGRMIEWSTELSEHDIVTGNQVVTGSLVRLHTVTFKNPFTGDIIEYAAYNHYVDEPEEFEVPGYNFDGWYLGEDKVTFPLQVLGDLVLTGRYNTRLYSVNFYLDKNRGTLYTGNTFPYNSSIVSITDPSKVDYDFVGWKTITGDNDISFPLRVTGDLDVYANFESAKYENLIGWDGCYEYRTYTGEDEGQYFAEITSYSGSCNKENLTITGIITRNNRNYLVKIIGSNAFSNKGLSGILTLQEGVEIVNSHSFNNNLIAGLNLPNSLIQINEGAFDGNSDLESINFGNGLETIGDSAFAKCGLKSLNFPSSLKIIGSYGTNGAFADNLQLEEVNFNEGLQEIRGYSFDHTNVVRFVMPSTLKKIGRTAFNRDSSLVELVLNEGLEEIGSYAFGANPNLKNIIIPSTVTSMGNSLFYNRQELTPIENLVFKSKMDLSNTSDNYFDGLSSTLKTLFRDGSGTIRNYMFSSLYNLESITFGSDVTEIGNYNFQNTKVSNLKIPGNIKVIGSSVFSNSKNLTSIEIETGVQSIENSSFSSNNLSELFIPDSVIRLDSSFYNPNGIKKIVIGNGVITLPSGIFNKSEEVIIGNSVGELSSSNFSDGTNLKKIKIGDGVTNINRWTFIDAKNLEEIEIGNSLIELKYPVFGGTPNLKNLKLGNSLQKIGSGEFAGALITGLILPASLQEIGTGAFLNNINLSSIIFTGNSNIQKIWSKAFNNAEITGIVLPSTLTKLGTQVFCSDGISSEGSVIGLIDKSLEEINDLENQDATACFVLKNDSKFTYTVTYDAASHSGTIINQPTLGEEVPYNTTIILPTENIVSQKGYQFIGWTKVLGGTEPMTEDQIITSDVTFYPVFKKDTEQRVVTFSGNGATLNGNNGIEITIPCTIPAVYNTGIQATTCPITTPSIQREGYEILGYSIDKNYKNICAITGNQEIQISGNELYYAITKKNLTATFNKNGNTAQIKHGESETTESIIEESCSIWNQETECKVRTPLILPATGKTTIGYTTSTISSGENLTGENTEIILSTSPMSYYAWTQSTPQEVKVNYVYSTGVIQGATTENSCWTEVRYNGDENQTGCMITLPILQVREGYVAPKWYRTESEVVETDNENRAMFYYESSPITLTGKAEVSGTISYVVKHYFQMLENDVITNKYALNQSYTDVGLSGELDTILILSGLKKEVEGFEYFKATVNGQPVNDIIDISQEIEYAETHQLTTPVEIKLLYTRNKYEYTLNQIDNVSTEGSTASNTNMYYGQMIVLSGAVTNDCYERSGWQGLPENVENTYYTIFPMPAGNVIITPTVEERTYTIVFDKNAVEAEGTVSAMENVRCSAQVQLDPNNVYTRNGYVFKEWNTNSDGTGTGYAKDAIITTALTKTGGAIVKLYAQWIANTYKVTFNANGGAVTQIEKMVTYDQLYGVLPVPTREGYAFSGWYTQAEGGEYITGTTKVIRTEDHILYAQWIANKYTVTFDVNSGVVIPKTIEVTYNQPYGDLPTPGRVGYTFQGWYTAKDGGTQVNQATQVITPNNHTLYAHWNVNSYTISYNLNGGELPVGKINPEAYTIESGNITLNNPIREGYDFIGWSGTDLTELTTEVIITQGSIGNREYKANWKIKTYTITWMNSTGSLLEKDENVEYGSMPSYDGEEPTSGGNVQYTYSFSGWNPQTGMVVEDQVYTAVYNSIVNQYAVTFVDEDGTVLKVATNYDYDTSVSDIEKPADPTKVADAQYTYSFAGWNPEIHNVTGAQVYTATYDRTINKYKVLWKNRDGYVLETDEDVEYGSNPKYDGDTPISGETVEYQYRFAGWDPSITNETIIEGDTVYTATYEPIKRKYQITWKDYDDQVIDTTEVEYGVIPTHVNLVRTGYEFNTWDPSPVEVTGPTSYKATYTIKQYAVTPEKGVGVDDILGGGTYDYGSEIVLTGIAKEGYHFEGGVTVKEFNVDVPAQNITVKINAQPNIYYVHFKNNGGEGVMNNQAFTYDQEQALTPNAYIRNGFTFVSWTDGEGGIYKDKAVVKNLITSGTINLIAQWIEGDVPGPTPPSPTPTPGGGGSSGGGRIIDKNTDDKEHDSAEDKQQEKDVKDNQTKKDLIIQTGGDIKQITGDTSVIVPEPVYKRTEEELTAYKYAYKYGITTLAPEYAAMPDDYVIRGHMAKMVVNYALNVLHRKLPEKLPRECRWLDGRNAWESQEIKDYAEKSCALGIMGIDMKYFQPKKYVTRAQFGTIIGRLMWGKLTSKPYYAGHLARLKERGIMTQIENPENRIEIRKWAWLMFMRMEKYIM